jgi:CRP/FNR family cyclic AMP-dependent transcriptional regulator
MTGGDYVDVMMRAAQSGAPGRLRLTDWNAEQWTKLLDSTTVKPFRASEVVIQLGVQDRALYLVAEGMLEVGVTMFDGVSVSSLARIEAGSVIGEQSFFDGEPRSANVWAVTDGALLRWEFEQYRRFGAQEPGLARDFLFGVAQVLSARLRLTTIRIRR